MADPRFATRTPRLLTVEEFLQIDFGPGMKAELDNGYIRMMAGGTVRHAQVQANILASLRVALRGSGCRPYGSVAGVRSHDLSLRYPDVTVDCGQTPDGSRHLSDPRAVFEVLSPATRDNDLGVKRGEYRTIAGLDTIVLIDPDAETVSVSQRLPGGWRESDFAAADVELPALDLVLPHAEIFARD